MSTERDRERLLQEASFRDLQSDRNPNEMVTVYLNDWIERKHSHCIYCALIPSNQIEQVLSYIGWTLSHGDGQPSATISYENGAKHVKYLRFGGESGIEPLVIDRSFHGIRTDYKEINEEFRLFHNLFHDRKEDKYIKIDEGGEEHVVGVVEPNQVKIRLKEIQQFLAIKEMHLLIQFDYKEFSEYTLEELGLQEGGNDVYDGLCCWSLYIGETIVSSETFSKLVGKRGIPPFPKSKSGFWGFAEEDKRYEEFIIGTDESGDDITHTCNPDELDNYFGANPGAPHFVTPVSFKKSVLDKYYQLPGKYEVSDGYLRCGSLWGVTIDNYHDDKVCAWLGDLGRDLRHNEQLHWKAHNIPSTTGVSETYYRRQIRAEFTDSKRPEHIFQRHYSELQEACRDNLGWQLILPLKSDDTYHLDTIRVPDTDEQMVFDQLVQSLSKILIDSLNSKSLKAFIPKEQHKELKGSISCLETALASCDVSDANEQIDFLRKLQNLRSTGSAHRKGGNFEVALRYLNPDDKGLSTLFAEMLEKCVVLLGYFIELVKRNPFRESE